MQATCKVFLDAARSSAVYKVASMAELPVAFGYDDKDHPEDGFFYRSARTGNPAAIFHVGMREFYWMGRHVAGGDTLLAAADAGDVQARYMCAMLLLTPGVGDEADAGRGLNWKPVVCRSSVCPTRGTMGAANDLSSVSSVHCLAEFEVLHFLSLFTFR
ncbi:hypothetical protein HN51_060209 [Arachis hypogaea]